MSTLAISADAGLPIVPPGLGAAAERYARLTLRKSEQTQVTYVSTYRRFADWLSHHTGHPAPPPAALTADAVAAYITELETRKAAATVKKERAAINRLAKYLHALGAIDATEILMIEGSRAAAQPRRRDALDAATWKRIKDAARARLHQGPPGRTSRAAAHRDLALILALGAMGVRSEETRALTTSSIAPKRADGVTPRLTVCGKGGKTRELPIPPEVADALLTCLEQRERILPTPGILFPRLGRQRADGRFPDAGPRVNAHGATIDDGRLSPDALRDIVRPVMLAAGVAPALARAPARAAPHLRDAVHAPPRRADRAAAKADGPRRHFHHRRLPAPKRKRPRGRRAGATPRACDARGRQPTTPPASPGARTGQIVNYPRRQQYRRLGRAIATGAGGLMAAGGALLAAADGALSIALVLLLVAIALGVRARHWTRLATPSRVGARSEEQVQRTLARLAAEGWRLRHSLRWQGC